MVILLPIALIIFFFTSWIIRHYTNIWIQRSITAAESGIVGFAAWLLLASIVVWFWGIVSLTLDFISTHDVEDIWILLFAALLTGYALEFYIRSKEELRFAETIDFFKEALQFRRSAQRRLTILDLMEQRRRRQNASESADTLTPERIKIQASIHQERETNEILSMLKQGKMVDLMNLLRINKKSTVSHPYYDSISEIRIDPTRKRVIITVDLVEISESDLTEDVAVLRFNRQVYDFFQAVQIDSRLKPFANYLESILVICRRLVANKLGESFFQPFFRGGILIEDLRKMEDKYFNPRKLGEIAAIAFRNGEAV